jgi:pimeloyl-ACP methyl ester carboxylesterase
MFLLIKGFKFYRQPRRTFFRTFPFRPMTLLSMSQSSCPELSYFCRPHRSTTKRPIVFIHGVGVGLLPYLLWLNSIPSDVGVLAIEILAVSSRICDPMPSSKELVAGINSIIDQQKIKDFVLVGNSFGTLLVSPMLQCSNLASCIDSVVLIDPVSLLLHLPNVAYNFSARKPEYGNEWQIWFVATDPRIAHTLARRLVPWHDFILWKEQLYGRRTTVVLGGIDNVTNPDAVASYIYYGDVNYTREDVDTWSETTKEWTGRRELELMYLPGYDHGQAFLSPKGMVSIQNVIDTYCQLEVSMERTYEKMEENVI